MVDACLTSLCLLFPPLAASAVFRMCAVMAVFLTAVAALTSVFAVVAVLVFAAAATLFLSFFVAAALRGAGSVMVWHIVPPFFIDICHIFHCSTFLSYVNIESKKAHSFLRAVILQFFT